MCVIVVTLRGWADVGLWVAACFLAKIFLLRPSCKTTFPRLTQSQAISQSFRVFITFRSMRDTTFFLFFEILFYTKLPFPLPWWSKNLLVDKLQVAGDQLRNPPVKFRHEPWLHLVIDQHPVCLNRARRELWPRKWFLLGRKALRYACRSIFSLEHVDRRRWKSILVWSRPLTSDLKRCLLFRKCFHWSSLKVVSVPTTVIGALRGSPPLAILLQNGNM